MSVIPDLKDIFELLKQGATIEARERIMQLRIAALDIQEENVRLREQLRQIQEQQKLQFDGLVYWLPSDVPDGKKDGPFCQRCFDEHGKKVRLYITESMSGRPIWDCRVCNQHYYIKNESD
jgi:hypothetical protein